MADPRPAIAGLLQLLLLVALVAGWPRPVAAGEYPGTIEEREAYRLLEKEQPIRAKELALRILTVHPRSYAAHLVLGRYYHEEEANLPRSQHHLQKARRLFEQQCGVSGERCGPEYWRWRARILLSLVLLTGDMDQREQELKWLDLYEEAYTPARHGLRAWALMKLGRFAEARQSAAQGVEQGNAVEQDSSWTALCAIASEEQQFEEADSVCNKAANRLAADPTDGTVEFRNAGHASLTMLRFDQAERLFLEATRRPVASYSNPWADLADLYGVEGRFSEAVQALSEARRYVLGRQPGYVFNDRSRADKIAANLLLALGLPEAALRMTRRSQLYPDRLGGTSAHQDQETGGAALLVRTAALTLVRSLEEQALLLPWHRRPRLWLTQANLRFEAWRSRRQAISVFSGGELLEASLRPMHPQSANLSSWLTGELVETLGPGVVLEAAARARRSEQRPGADAYLDAVEAEAWLARGDAGRALTLAQEALTKLPIAEVLLRARVAAVAARAAHRQGLRRVSLELYEEALHHDPGVFRRRNWPLPVRLTGDGSGVAQAALELLERSPRLEVGQPGFTIQVASREICLIGPSGATLGCTGPLQQPRDRQAQEEPLEPAASLVRGFHEVLLAPAIDLIQYDIRSLEGSPTTGRPADQAMKSLLERITQ